MLANYVARIRSFVFYCDQTMLFVNLRSNFVRHKEVF